MQSVRFATRRELEFIPRQGNRGQEWVVSDPIRDEYYVLNWNEFQIVQKLRIPQTLEQLAESLRGILPHSIQLDDLRNFLGRLLDENLIRTDQIGGGNRLWESRQMARRRRSRLAVFSLLSIRIPGINPDWILNVLAPVGRLLFHPGALIVIIAAALATIVFAGLSVGSVIQKTPSWETLTSPLYLTTMLLAFVVIKVFHELGHGLASRRFGGNCSEMGILFLVFLPCLYCDVSQTWKQPNRFKRAMVALAGVYVEILIATACFWVWFLSAPGFLHTCAFSLMIIASLNTLLVNGNPLLRYDGYYVLSDLANVPNLAQTSQQQLARAVQKLFFYDADDSQSTERISTWQVYYAVLSAVYRYFILIAILWAIAMFFRSRDLVYMGYAFTGAIGLILAVPLVASVTRIGRAFFQGGKRWIVWLFAIAAVGIIGIMVAGIPVHSRIVGTAHFFVRDAELVYSQADGQFFPHFALGQTIQAQEELASIENHELITEQIAKRGQLREAEQRLSDLLIQQGLGAKTESEIEFIRTRIVSLQDELQELGQIMQRLSVKTQRAGTVLALTPQQDETPAKKFFHAATRGLGVRRGELLCVIGDPGQLVGFVAVPQSQIELVKIGDRVKIFIPQRESTWGTVRNVSISSGDATQDDNFNADLNQTDYVVEFDLEGEQPWVHGSHTTCAILGRRMTILELIGRAIQGAFFW
jgi:putative peptide zinc metalloprotease protein